MTLTTQLRSEYIEMFDNHLYTFPDDCTIAVRYPLKAALNKLLNPVALHNPLGPVVNVPVDPQFKAIIDPLTICLDNPGAHVKSYDHNEFLELLKSRIRLAIRYLETSTDDELQQLIDEKLAAQWRTRPHKKTAVAIKSPQLSFNEALNDLDITLQDPTYADNLKAAGKAIRDIIAGLQENETTKGKGLTRVLITTNAIIKHPSVENTEACQRALNQVDKDTNDRLNGVVHVLIGIAILTVLAVAMAMSVGAFAPIGIPAFGIFASVLIIELGVLLGVPAGIATIAVGVEKIAGDPRVNAAKQGFFELKKAAKENPPDVPGLDKPI